MVPYNVPMSKKHSRKGFVKKASRLSGPKSPSAPLSENILALMREAGHPLGFREILRRLSITTKKRSKAREVLDDLVQKGTLIHLKGNRYGLPHKMDLVTGTISVHPDGFGFVKPEEGDGKDVFIPPRSFKGAVHGDKVVARIARSTVKGPEGGIIRILKRSTKRVVGTFHRYRKICRVVPEDERLFFEILIPGTCTQKAKNGDVVLAEIEAYSPEGRNPEGRVIEVLGDPNDLSVQTKIVIYKHGLPSMFHVDAVSQAKALPRRLLPEDIKGRKDLRDLPLVTIDGEDARDFDDAVCVKKTQTGFVLTVAIADVSHYVSTGSPIDHDALERGTSVYFPNAVVPMLPEALSNHLCSLVPDEDRLAMVARITYDREANVKRTIFFKAVMRSHRRFTYTEVARLLSEKNTKPAGSDRKHLMHLSTMAELAGALTTRRRERGTIDFDLPEPQIILDLTGKLEEIVKRERNIAHFIIEEFMIAANEAVASFFEKAEVPALYRVHDEPDPKKVEDFGTFARSIGMDVTFPEHPGPRWFQQILSSAEGKPQEYMINTVLLRTMMQAAYTPENSGHFGLASRTYLHFTSPIRRYPDLVVHRILKGNLRTIRKRPVYAHGPLTELGTACSERERTALEAEREMVERLKVRYMADKVGEVSTLR